VKVLVVRMSSIGDVVHALPAAAALARAGHEVSWLVEPPAAPLVSGNPAVAHTVVAPPRGRFRLAPARRVVGELRAGAYDAALDLQGLWKSAAWSRLSGARRVIGYESSGRREGASAFLLDERLRAATEARHVIDLNLSLLESVGLREVGTREFPLPPESEASPIPGRLEREGFDAFCVLNPAGGWANKLWPAERFGQLAAPLRERGLTPVVTWGPGEEELADRVVAASSGAAVKCFATTLLDLVALIRRARLLVAADTGPLHLACAVGTPVVGLYGPTDPARNGPFSRDDEVVRRSPSCAPCHKRRCPIHARIMDEIPAVEVVQAMARRLVRAPAKRASRADV
jgi:lipopolysaccharide heptosyltransferase I